MNVGMTQELKKLLPVGAYRAIETLLAQGSEVCFKMGAVVLSLGETIVTSHLSWKVGFRYIVFQTITKGS